LDVLISNGVAILHSFTFGVGAGAQTVPAQESGSSETYSVKFEASANGCCKLAGVWGIWDLGDEL
jgi:hypothetical protein